jgi:hypothetical protein
MEVLSRGSKWVVEDKEGGWWKVEFVRGDVTVMVMVQADDDYSALRAGKVAVLEKINRWAKSANFLLPEADMEFQKLYDLIYHLDDRVQEMVLERMAQISRYRRDGTPPNDDLRMRLYRELGFEYIHWT